MSGVIRRTAFYEIVTRNDREFRRPCPWHKIQSTTLGKIAWEPYSPNLLYGSGGKQFVQEVFEEKPWTKYDAQHWAGEKFDSRILGLHDYSGCALPYV